MGVNFRCCLTASDDLVGVIVVDVVNDGDNGDTCLFQVNLVLQILVVGIQAKMQVEVEDQIPSPGVVLGKGFKLRVQLLGRLPSSRLLQAENTAIQNNAPIQGTIPVQKVRQIVGQQGIGQQDIRHHVGMALGKFPQVSNRHGLIER